MEEIKQIIENNKELDLEYKAFLRPMEIALKTWETEKDYQHQGRLPNGIKRVIKKNIEDNKFKLDDFEPVKTQQIRDGISLEDLRDEGRDNMISLLKPTANNTSGLRLAICVCMYSQDEQMLLKTLTGICRNITMFNLKGIPSHEIGVFVFIDGIQTMHPSIIQFYEKLEKQNKIYFSSDVESLSLDDLSSHNFDFQDEQIKNITNLLFRKKELENIMASRIGERRASYLKVRGMMKKIQKLQKYKGDWVYEKLEDFVKPFYLEKAREKYLKNHPVVGGSEEDLSSFYVDFYRNQKQAVRNLVNESLAEARRYCEEYIRIRDNLALMSSFRIQISEYIDLEDREVYPEENISEFKMNLFMICKYKNRGKLSSHNWFFNGFCQELRPEYSVLLDVGLVPESKSLFKMIKHMAHNPFIGGVCGYMGLRVEKTEEDQKIKNNKNVDCLTRILSYFFDIQKAQQLQYHFAHLIDKPFESSFGFIHVLPGAFSAYRMDALGLHSEEESELLRKYFKSIEENVDISYSLNKYHTVKAILRVIFPNCLFYAIYNRPKKNSDEGLLYQENVYLAEDRTLCIGIHQKGYKLAFLPDAHAHVDPVKTLQDLMGQRKRWSNGSFFAFEEVKEKNRQRIDEQECSKEKIFLWLQVRFLTFLNNLFFISPTIFLFTIHLGMSMIFMAIFGKISSALFPPQEGETYQEKIEKMQEISQNISEKIVYIFDFVYVITFFGMIFFSLYLKSRNQNFIPYFYGVSTFNGILAFFIFIFMMISMIVDADGFLKTDQTQIPIYYPIITSVLLYIVPMLLLIALFCRFYFLVDIVSSAASFIYYIPTYIIVLNVYALCRIDDISWATKGLNEETSTKTKELEQNWKKIKFLYVFKFLFWNFILGFVLIQLSSVKEAPQIRNYIALCIMLLLVFTIIIRVILASVYIIRYKCKAAKQDKYIPNIRRVNKIRLCFENIKNSLYAQIQKNIQGGYESSRDGGNSPSRYKTIRVSERHQELVLDEENYRPQNSGNRMMNLHEERLHRDQQSWCQHQNASRDEASHYRLSGFR